MRLLRLCAAAALRSLRARCVPNVFTACIQRGGCLLHGRRPTAPAAPQAPSGFRRIHLRLPNLLPPRRISERCARLRHDGTPWGGHRRRLDDSRLCVVGGVLKVAQGGPLSDEFRGATLAVLLAFPLASAQVGYQLRRFTCLRRVFAATNITQGEGGIRNTNKRHRQPTLGYRGKTRVTAFTKLRNCADMERGGNRVRLKHGNAKMGGAARTRRQDLTAANRGGWKLGNKGSRVLLRAA